MNDIYCLPLCRLASTPAMFNSTLTEDDALLCPADGSIMITGELFCSVRFMTLIHLTRLKNCEYTLIRYRILLTQALYDYLL